MAGALRLHIVHPSIHHIFNEKLTKRNNVQYEGKNMF